MKTVVVFGRPGCGKSRNAKRLMMAYGCLAVQDEWNGVLPLQPGTLALTQIDPPYAAQVDEVVSFDEAVAAA